MSEQVVETPITAPQNVPENVEKAIAYIRDAHRFVEITWGLKVNLSLQLTPVEAAPPVTD